MTRLNLVPVSELSDQHLFAEWREIKMVPRSLARSLRARGHQDVLDKVPPRFRLGPGHVSFFYDKGEYLRMRYGDLTAELLDRGYELSPTALLDKTGVYDQLPPSFHKRYTPSEEALMLARDRIRVRLDARPGWYKLRGVPM